MPFHGEALQAPLVTCTRVVACKNTLNFTLQHAPLGKVIFLNSFLVTMSAEGDHVEAAPAPVVDEAPAVEAPAPAVAEDAVAPAPAPEAAAPAPQNDGGYGGDGYGAPAPAPAPATDGGYGGYGGAPAPAPSGGSSDGLSLFVGGLPNPCNDEAFEELAKSFGATIEVNVRT